MKLVKFGIKNFRGFGDKLELINLDDFTCIIGKNDAGKSSVFEAMNIFFNGYKNIDNDDWHIESHDKIAKEIELRAFFKVDDDKIKIESVNTSLKEEGLINKDGFLEIIQKITSSTKSGMKVFINGYLPDNNNVKDIHKLKNKDLKDRFDEIKNDEKLEEDWKSINHSNNTEMRKAIISYFSGSRKEKVSIEIPTDKESGKEIWENFSRNLPLFQLFKTDRENNDSDSEIQDPLKAITKKTLQENIHLKEQLDEISNKIEEEALKEVKKTLKKLHEMDPNLAKQLTPEFADPSWQNVFKFSLSTDQIPLNKRGSGTRRLILLNFFRAEAEQSSSDSDSNNIIYAFEEPETAQHVDHQRMLLKSFKEISKKNGQQVFITTHSPELAALSSTSLKDIPNVREVKQDNGKSKINNKPDLLKISNELGIYSNVPQLPGRLRLAILVEGPNDIPIVKLFLKYYCQDICNNKDIVIIPFGGGTFKQWMDMKILNDLNAKTYCIFDKDVAGNKYVRELSGNNFHQWLLGPVEFYFPYSEYEKEVIEVNKSKEKSGDPLLNVISEENYHSADYKSDIKPLKKSFWSYFNRLDDKSVFLDYWKKDNDINDEFKDLAKEIEKYYNYEDKE